MRVLYLIFAHHRPEQLVRLAGAVAQLSPNALIAVHYDPKDGVLDPDLFSAFKVIIIPNPVCGEWGGYSQVEQYLHAMRWCIENLQWDWLCILTGLSYPINSLQTFERQLEISDYDAFIRYFDAFNPPPGVWPPGEGQRRYLYAYYRLPRFAYYYKLPQNVKRFLSKTRDIFNQKQPWFKIIPMPRGAKTRFGVRRPRLPFNSGFKPYCGRQMLNLNRLSVRKIFDFLSRNPKYEKYFKRTLHPDEGFFITILMNDPDLRVCNDVMRFIKWPKGIGASMGVPILKEEVDAVVQSGMPFALKFDMQLEPAAMDRIDMTLGLRWNEATRVQWEQNKNV